MKAGIPSNDLSIALEPEAASLFCKHLPVEKLPDAKGIGVFRPGAKYMVLDCGGTHIVCFRDNVKSIKRNKIE